MEISENSDELPEQYYCEQCRPEDHKELLAKIARGQKPWEERARQREREAEEKKSRRRKGGKKGKKGRPSEIHTEKSDGAASNEAPPAQPSPQQTTVITTPEVGQKRKFPSEETTDRIASVEQVSRITEAVDLRFLTIAQEPMSKIRKVSSPVDIKPPPQRRKSSAISTPSRSDSKGVLLQLELVETISELQSEARRKAANALVKLFVDQTKQAQKQGTFKVPPGQTFDSFGLKLGLSVEYAIYMNFWGNAGEPSPQYREKLLMMLHNIKANPKLRDRLLVGKLSPNELSQMSSFDMASKELQEKTAEMKKDAEKQHMLIQEEGPRIRRTHKGEEIVGDDTQGLTGTDTIFSNIPSRKRESESEPSVPKHTSPVPISPQSPNVVELPSELSHAGVAASPTTSRPLSVDTRAPSRPSIGQDRKSSSTFNIQNVWSSVDSPDVEKQRTRQLPQAYPPVIVPEPTPGPNIQADADIDHLLKDEEPDDEEPYSPTDYDADPGTVWRGNMVMANVADFAGTAKHVAGANLSGSHPWSHLMPHILSIEGRIDIEKASSYLCGLQWSKTTDVSVVAITPNETIDDQIQFTKLFAYFTERNRYGVIGKSPDTAVRDIYVVPLETGSSKKPDFIELLEHCTIEDPRPSRMLLVAYVVKSKIENTSSAQATPRQLDSTTIPSPVSSQAPAQYRTPVPMGHPGLHMSPVTHFPGAPSYGSPGQQQQPFIPPQHPGYAPSYTNNSTPHPNLNPTGIDAARQVLGDMANSPVITELLSQVPNTGITEFGFVKEVFESVPASRNNFEMLMSLLTMRSQQGASSSGGS